MEPLERQPISLARCRICRRRLKSQPWKVLGIGPICARKHPEITDQLRKAYLQQRQQENAALDKREIDTLDVALRRAMGTGVVF